MTLVSCRLSSDLISSSFDKLRIKDGFMRLRIVL